MAPTSTVGEAMGLTQRPTYADRILAKVKRSQPEERESVLEFRSRLYGKRDPEHVTWMYDRAPSASHGELSLWTWETNGRVEAHQGAIRTVLRIGGKERKLSWAMDLFVSPEFRSRGVGAALPSKVIDEADVVAGTEVSESAQKSFARAGWTHLGNVPLWFRPLDGAESLRVRLPDSRLRLGGGLLTVVLRLQMHASSIRTRGYRLTSSAHFDERADMIWTACADNWPLIAKRNLEWLTWRWDLNPDFETTKVWLEHRGQPIGWAVLAVRDRGGLRAGLILDLLCPPEHVFRLLALIVRHFYDERDVHAVYCKFRAPGTSRSLRLAGFVNRDSGFAMMVYAEKLSPPEREIAVDAEHWYLTAGDSDLDRVRTPLLEDVD